MSSLADGFAPRMRGRLLLPLPLLVADLKVPAGFPLRNDNFPMLERSMSFFNREIARTAGYEKGRRDHGVSETGRAGFSHAGSFKATFSYSSPPVHTFAAWSGIWTLRLWGFFWRAFLRKITLPRF